MIISLLTDFGLEDNFIGVVKGIILGINPEVKIIDISHSVMPGDILQAAFLLKSSYRYFPCATIHLVVVDPGVGSRRKAIVAKTKRYYFVGPDNGVLSLALDAEEKVTDIVSIANWQFFLKPVSSTFHARDIFAPVVSHLSCGRNITDFGTSQKGYKRLQFPSPKIVPAKAGIGIEKKTLQGQIIYIDHFGNLITNIRKDIFRRFVGKSNFRIVFKDEVISNICKSYVQAKRCAPLAIFGSFGNLELSVSRGSAKDYFAAKKGLKVQITVE